ncbi:MSC_0882 family membrane protein [Mycoplasma leonicaptivi]|uniref:MSC_0882 family membrane protein n=1 Tax=Mycoplasma leonicaptivi TaxID=36742 RepID=UPI000565A7CD|nr:hypothetical protein [Mycoplasma leonicaptivi]
MLLNPRNSQKTLEISLQQSSTELNDELNKKIIEDPQKQLSPTTFAIILKEKRIRILSLIISLIIFVGSSVGLVLNFFVFTEQHKLGYGIGNYIGFGIGILISFYLMINSLIKISGWRKAEQAYRNKHRNGDVASSSMFTDLYQALVLKKVRISWFLTFFLVYFGTFTLIIFLLKDQIWEIGSPVESSESGNVKNGFAFHFVIDFRERFVQTFGNVNVLLIISVVIILCVILFYVFTVLYDKKRIQDIRSNLGTSDVLIKVIEIVENRRKNENKAWLRFFAVVFILTYFLPLTLLIFFIYKGFIRRKK